ncbi:MAG: hypothetical protein MUC80_05925 [Candidatus Thermoplasmatota archaeon]|jgi:hypothetical protein|nr:hypothetical protein [Candidatus Thermoplasmatota archaeon]
MKNKIPLSKKGYTFGVCFTLMISIGLGGFLTAQEITNNISPSIIVKINLSEPWIFPKIIEKHLTILEIDQKKTSVIVLVSADELTWLSSMNYSYQIVSDVEAKKHGWIHSTDFNRDFHSYSQMTTELQSIASTYPDIARLYDIGHSVQGRTLWGLKVTDNPDDEENEPEVRICGNHHGDEYMSAELPLNLAWLLVQNYSIDPTITDLVDNREIWIIPMVNPDGHEANTRYNAHGVDLNRNYGYMPESATPYSEPETQAMRNNALQNNYVLSLSFHCSGNIVNYIWNYKTQPVADNPAVVFLSEQYGSHNGYWVVEGYDWYQTLGDCNDFSYGCRGDIDWTIEVQSSGEDQAWNLNRDAMLEIIDAAEMGLTGVVTNANTGQPIPATVWVEEAFWPCFADPDVGDYHKILLPGSYTVHFQANGFEEKIITVDVESGEPTVLNVALTPAPQYFAYQVTTCAYYAPSDNYQNNPTDGIACIGIPDDNCASLGVGGYIILDMLNPITDIPDANDVKIYEGDSTSDGYQVLVSSDWQGPWVSLGSGMGTAEFDLADGSVESARYVKIVDDGNGNPSEVRPAADIDAVENLATANQNQPPDNPMKPEGPTAGGTNIDYTYTTMTDDPESQQVFYQWSWGDSSSSWIGPFNSGATMQTTHQWNASGDYLVKVKAKDSEGVESGWSDALEVRIEDAPHLEIGEITGGFGSITTKIHNTGAGDAINVNWSISLQGGLVFLGRQTTGTILKIIPGLSPQIQSSFILGLGKVTIEVTVGTTEKTALAFLLGPLVIVQQ